MFFPQRSRPCPDARFQNLIYDPHDHTRLQRVDFRKQDLRTLPGDAFWHLPVACESQNVFEDPRTDSGSCASRHQYRPQQFTQVSRRSAAVLCPRAESFFELVELRGRDGFRKPCARRGPPLLRICLGDLCRCCPCICLRGSDDSVSNVLVFFAHSLASCQKIFFRGTAGEKKSVASL